MELVGEDKKRIYIENNVSKEKTVKCPELVYNHFQYRDAVDAHNSSRMYPIALEETWNTTRWPCRVFFLAVTDVNCWLALTKIYNQPEMSQQEFRKLFSRELLHNKHLCQPAPSGKRKSKRKSQPDHCLVSLPKNRTFRKSSIVFTKTAYIQLVCSGCGQCWIRMYCSCTPGKVICSSCFADHVHLLES